MERVYLSRSIIKFILKLPKNYIRKDFNSYFENYFNFYFWN